MCVDTGCSLAQLYAVLGQLLFKCNSLHITYYLQLNYLVTVTYYPYNKVTIIIYYYFVSTTFAVTCETTTLSRDMIALLDNV